LNYSWQFNGTSLTNGSQIIGTTTNQISGAATNVLVLTGTTTNNNGTYEVTVTNAFGSTNSSAVLTVLTAPEILNFGVVNGSINNGLNTEIVGGTNGGQFFVLASTNLLAPFSSWSTIANASFNSQGRFSAPLTTNLFNPNNPQEFFILSSTNFGNTNAP